MATGDSGGESLESWLSKLNDTGNSLFFSSESMFNVFPLWQCDYIFLSFDNNLPCGSHLEMLHLEVVRD